MLNYNWIKDKLISLINVVDQEILSQKVNDNVEDEIVKKGKANYVTLYDVAIENFLKEELQKLIPNSSFYGEETGGSIGEEYTWIVDPIDGTTNFIHGLPFAISVGLVYQKKIILGVV